MCALIKKAVRIFKKQSDYWRIVSLFLIAFCLFLTGSYLFLEKTSFLQFFRQEKFEKEESLKISEPAPVFNFFRLLDGVGVESEEKVNPPIFAAQVENIIEARPLSGISKASLVYETLSEAGITRLLALYTADAAVEEIGPVRSARPYFIDWASEYGALYAHSGGSPEALRTVSQYDVLDLNEFWNGQYFWRSRARSAPHNLYTSIEKLGAAFSVRGGEIKDLERWQFKNPPLTAGSPSPPGDKPLAPQPSPRWGEGENMIKINFSTPVYAVGWQYNSERNDYLRYQAGEVQKDKDGSEVRAKNIVVQFAKMKVLDYEGRRRIDTIGNGDAIVFQDGQVLEGEWKKEKKGARTKFFGADGAEIKFNPGVIWVEVVPVGAEVGF